MFCKAHRCRDNIEILPQRNRHSVNFSPFLIEQKRDSSIAQLLQVSVCVLLKSWITLVVLHLLCSKVLHIPQKEVYAIWRIQFTFSSIKSWGWFTGIVLLLLLWRRGNCWPYHWSDVYIVIYLLILFRFPFAIGIAKDMLNSQVFFFFFFYITISQFHVLLS